jgi:transposase
VVEDVKLDVSAKRIDFEVSFSGAASQPVHDRLRRSWRYLDFLQFEAWLQADLLKVAYSGCGKTIQLHVSWVRQGSGITAAFAALALALCRDMPLRQAAA